VSLNGAQNLEISVPKGFVCDLGRLHSQ